MGTSSRAAARAAGDSREKNARRDWVFMTHSFPVVPTPLRWVNWICHESNREPRRGCPLYCPLYLTAPPVLAPCSGPSAALDEQKAFERLRALWASWRDFRTWP